MVNVDAALFEASISMGSGVVIRDHMGNCVAARCDSFPNVQVPELAEALAIRCALVFAREENMDNICVASDCLSMVQQTRSSSRDRSVCAPIIEDIKTLLNSFSSCSITHVSRVQNFAAHCLAWSCELLPTSVWRGVSPECIRQTICIESPFG
jgi:hypothetical protein